MSNIFRPKVMSRRNFLKGSLAASMAMAWTPALRALAAEQAKRNAARLARQDDNVLRIIALNWPQSPIEQQLADEVFTPETGIEVVLQFTDYGFTEQRIYQLIATGSSEFDIYHYDSQWIGGFVVAGALEQLDTDTYLNSGSPGIAFEDFYPSIADRIGRYNNGIYGLPWSSNAQIMWYRNDIVDTPPTTWDEVRQVARDITTDEIYGWVWQGNRTADWIVVDYCPVLWSHGGELWDPENWIADGYVNSAEAVQALELMRAMVDPEQDGSVDPASANWTIAERGAAYAQGRAAMGLNWAPLGGGQDNMSYSLAPAGPGGQFTQFGSQGTGINALSTKKEQAWTYLQWLLSSDTQTALTTNPAASFFSARQDLQEVSSSQSAWHAAFADSIPIIKDFWNNASYAQLMSALGGELNLAYIGRKEAQEALDDAAIAHQAIYDSSPENPANM